MPTQFVGHSLRSSQWRYQGHMWRYIGSRCWLRNACIEQLPFDDRLACGFGLRPGAAWPPGFRSIHNSRSELARLLVCEEAIIEVSTQAAHALGHDKI
jgi:hypothetical protein